MTGRERAGLSRAMSAVSALSVIVLGLMWRRPELGLPWTVAKYGGSVLWGAMAFFLVSTVFGPSRPRVAAFCACAISAAVEASQAFSSPSLDAFRRTAFGGLLLGRTFDWRDIAAYWAGIGVAASLSVIVALLARRHSRERR